jgi:hypothetical protein
VLLLVLVQKEGFLGILHIEARIRQPAKVLLTVLLSNGHARERRGMMRRQWEVEGKSRYETDLLDQCSRDRSKQTLRKVASVVKVGRRGNKKGT